MIKLATIPKVTKSAKIREYVAAHPKAKSADIAKAVGVTPAYVATVLWTAKKKAKVAKKAKPQAQVDKYWKAVGEVQKAGLSPERIAELTIQAGKPKARMQSNIDKIKLGDVVGGLTLTDVGNNKVRWVNKDPVKHPAHYKVGGIETIDFIEAKKLGYNLGNVVKYITRADHKGNKLEDLRKAQWYLEREVWNVENNKKTA